MLIKYFENFTFTNNASRVEHDDDVKNVGVHFKLKETDELRERLRTTMNYNEDYTDIKHVDYFLDIFFDDKFFVSGERATWIRLECVVNNEDTWDLEITKSEITDLLYKTIDFLANNK